MAKGSTQATYSISDLARAFDVTTRTIRHYEDQGLIAPAREGQRRIYTNRDRVRLKLIMRGKRLGFTLDEIRELIDMYDAEPGEAGQLRRLLEKIAERRDTLLRQRADIDATLAELDRLEAQGRDALAAREG